MPTHLDVRGAHDAQRRQRRHHLLARPQAAPLVAGEEGGRGGLAWPHHRDLWLLFALLLLPALLRLVCALLLPVGGLAVALR